MPDHRPPSRRPSHVKQWRLANERGIRWAIDPQHTRDQIRALANAGWSAPELARRLDRTQSAVWQLQNGHRGKVYRDTALRIDTLYRELRFTPGPSTKAATHAAAKGWPTVEDLEYGPITSPPNDDIDPVAIERALTGDSSVTLNRHEVLAAIVNSPLSRVQTANQLGISHRQVLRLLAKHQDAA